MKLKSTLIGLGIFTLGVFLAACHSNLSQRKVCEGEVEKSTDACPENNGPLPYTLYVRGGFNGWGSDHPFSYVGNGIYEAPLLTAPGNHEFKLASVDWRHEWVIKAEDKTPAQLDKTYLLERGASGSFFLVRETGHYRFIVDYSNPEQPTLLIKRDKAAQTPTRDVHKNHKTKTSISYPTWDGKSETVSFSADYLEHSLRRYGQSSTQEQRDPIPKYIVYEEQTGYPRMRSGNLQFDALFAMSLEEMRLNGVENIRDGNYNNGDSIPCDCFETGAKWHYVWTRDLSYAAHLGLAMLDPQRVQNSLEFKLSPYRDGISKAAAVPGTDDGLQIVQDTGTGGSWPISTDRMTWSFGAEKVLENLRPKQQQAFAKRAYKALVNTLEIDRAAVFDSADGLYLGEQSFLDWREQTYASWITDDIASLGSSKSLSTNVGHYNALKLASDLAERMGNANESVRYEAWAADLKAAINERFWQQDNGLYSSITAPHFDGAPLYKYDWLGISLAVITGVADDARARQAIANYPHGPLGAPVIFPQQPNIPVYHNRAIWPFVTAYGLKAAATVGNSRVADAAYATLIRGASLNLSNMENLEWLSAQPLLLDEQHPRLSGPVINSQRQLWSVGAYLGMAVDTLFGVKTDNDGLHFAPFITSKLRREQFPESRSIALHDLTLRGKNFDISIFLPEATTKQGYYSVREVLINGQAISSARLEWTDAKASNTVVIRLGELIEDTQDITRIEGNPYAAQDPHLYAPVEPRIVSYRFDKQVPVFEIEDTANTGRVSYALYRDGQPLGTFQATKQLRGEPINPEQPAGCYSVEARFDSSQTRSHHSVPLCLHRGQEISVSDPRVQSNSKVLRDQNGRKGAFLLDWGRPEDNLTLESLRIEHPGRYAIQLKYHNAYNEINLGVTNGVKWLVLLDENNNSVAEGVIQMPHAKVVDGKRPWVYSTPLVVDLPRGSYSLRVEEFTNMSYLQANVTFSNSGGASGPVNRMDVSGFRVTRLQHQ